MRFHLLALPNANPTRAYSLDGFSQVTLRMARLLKQLGHHVTLYASDPEENEAPCDELVTVITVEEQRTLLEGLDYQYAGFFGQKSFPLWALANARAVKEIQKRKQPRDFILIIGGTSQQQVADAHPDLITVEYSIGYLSSFAKYRVYESHVWRAMTAARQGSEDGRFFDATIPLFFDETEFTFQPVPEPFALYVGRLTVKKGLEIACRSAQAAGIPLKVIGHGDTSLVTHGAEYLGALPAAERNNWMARASVLLTPTIYIEPFGGVVVEAALCGTPAVTTDWGGFTETVEHGRTGFRCHYLGDFTQAIKDAPKLDRQYVRQRAVDKYSIGTIKNEYQKYFERLLFLWAGGWDTLTPMENR